MMLCIFSLFSVLNNKILSLCISKGLAIKSDKMLQRWALSVYTLPKDINFDENIVVTSIFSFSHYVFKRFLVSGC